MQLSICGVFSKTRDFLCEQLLSMINARKGECKRIKKHAHINLALMTPVHKNMNTILSPLKGFQPIVG